MNWKLLFQVIALFGIFAITFYVGWEIGWEIFRK